MRRWHPPHGLQAELRRESEELMARFVWVWDSWSPGGTRRCLTWCHFHPLASVCCCGTVTVIGNTEGVEPETAGLGHSSLSSLWSLQPSSIFPPPSSVVLPAKGSTVAFPQCVRVASGQIVAGLGVWNLGGHNPWDSGGLEPPWPHLKDGSQSGLKMGRR